MPLYEYSCKNCGIIEVRQSINDVPLKNCPQCEKEKVERLISTTGAPHFRGKGFYQTDYKKSGS